MNNMIGKYTFNGCCVLAGPENFLRPRFGPSERELARTGDLFDSHFVSLSSVQHCNVNHFYNMLFMNYVIRRGVGGA